MYATAHKGPDHDTLTLDGVVRPWPENIKELVDALVRATVHLHGTGMPYGKHIVHILIRIVSTAIDIKSTRLSSFI